MSGKITLLVPEAPAPQAEASAARAGIHKGGLRLGVLDNSKGNADHLLAFVVAGLKALMPVASVVSLRKASVSLGAAKEILDRLAGDCDFVVTAMAD